MNNLGIIDAVDDCALDRIVGSGSLDNVDRVSNFRSISIIFPAYNEEENIVKVIEQARDVISKIFDDFEIIVVNDGSHDNTGVIIDEMRHSEPVLFPVHHAQNKGYGATLRSGIEAASKDLIFFTDSDLQFDISEITHLLYEIDDYDIVAGYRADRADPAHRRFNAWGWNVLVRMVLGLKIRDIDCAFKLFRRGVFNDIRLESVGAMINTEILVQAQWQKKRLKEVPVRHFPRVAGEQSGANLRVICKALYELLSMRSRLKRVSHNNVSVTVSR